MKELLCICGSPRRYGNTEILVDKVIEGITKKKDIKIEKIILQELNIASCQACEYCHKKGYCIIKDDMQKLYKKILTLDYLIVASPIYFRSISSQLKIMIDRAQLFWVRRFLLNKKINKKRKGIFISICATRGKEATLAFNAAKQIIKAFFSVIQVKYKYELLVEGIEQKGVILNNKQYLDKAVRLGKMLIRDKG